MTKHVVVEFLFKGISTLTLSDFNNQNVLFGLALEKTGEGFRPFLMIVMGLLGRLKPMRFRFGLNPANHSTPISR
jgi:hypothetical protein